MFFYRTSGGESGASAASIRALRFYSTTAIVAFPVAMLIGLIDASGPAGSLEAWLGVAVAMAKAALMILAFFMIFKVVTSGVHRIVGEEPGRLDEMEIQLRQRALSWSYGIVGASVLMLIGYAMLASDLDLWIPADSDEWNGLFWSLAIYIMLLPTAFLAWTMDPADDEDE